MEGQFRENARAPFLPPCFRDSQGAFSLSSLVLLPLSLLHHARGPETPNNLRFLTQPDLKSSKIHLPNPSRALCCIIWQKVKGFSHVSVELGCDSSHQM